MKQPPRPTFQLGHVRVDTVTRAQALGRTEQMVTNGGGTVFTPNVHHIALAQRDAAFAAAYARAGLCLCDGKPLQWTAAAMGEQLVHNPGSRFLPDLLRHAAARRWRAYFVGGRVGVQQRLPAVLQRQFAGLDCVGISAPTRLLLASAPQQNDALGALVTTIAQRRPAVVFVSLPSPLQEIWADATYGQRNAGVFVCTGSAIDRIAGLAAEPPAWLGARGLEWAWRIGQEPQRLAPRYAADAVAFAPIAFAAGLQALRRRCR